MTERALMSTKTEQGRDGGINVEFNDILGLLMSTKLVRDINVEINLF